MGSSTLRLICRAVGHKPGQHENRWYSCCLRCGTSDMSELYRTGIFEALPWRIRIALRTAEFNFRAWCHSDCTACGKPAIRFGREVGNHEDCDEIPF